MKLTLDIPVVETERLVLRGWTETDITAHERITADPEVMRYYPGTMNRAETWRAVAAHVGHWVIRGFGQWVVELRETGEHIGRLGLYQPEGWPGLEVGWFLAREHWGRGYATEGGRASLDYAWNVLGADRVVSVIRPENEPSIRVAQRLGLRPVGDFHHAGFDHVVYGIDRSAR